MAIETETLACEPLLELATPQFYRRNLFRVLRLPISASPADVRRRQKLLDMQGKLGVASNDGADGPLALQPPPDEEEIRAAMDRLNDPKARLLDEVFWFWPHNGDAAADPALQALERGQVRQAAEIWTRQAKQKGQSQVACHNLAILHHLLALDHEAGLASQGQLTAAQHKALAEAWCATFVHWLETLENDGFWNRVKDRVRELNDAQLTTGFVRRLRETLPKVLLLINAQIAVNAAERKDVKIAERHARLLQEAGFAEGLAAESLRKSLKPIRHRIKAVCENAGPTADQDPEHADKVMWSILEKTRPLLAIVDAVLPSDDPIRQGLHDDVATTALGCQISYGNKTEDWDESLRMLDAVLRVAAGAAMRERIERNIGIVTKNREVGLCHFCGQRQCKDKNNVKVKIWGNLKKTPSGYNSYEVTWNHGTINVPRCPYCARHHMLGGLYGFLGAAGLVLVGTLVALMIAASNSGFSLWDATSSEFEDIQAVLWIGLIGGGGVIGIPFGLIFNSVYCKRHGIKTWGSTNSFSVLKERLEQGWHLGQEPSQEQKQNA